MPVFNGATNERLRNLPAPYQQFQTEEACLVGHDQNRDRCSGEYEAELMAHMTLRKRQEFRFG